MWMSVVACFVLSMAMHLPWLGITPLAEPRRIGCCQARDGAVAVVAGAGAVWPAIHDQAASASLVDRTVGDHRRARKRFCLASAVDGHRALLCAATAWFAAAGLDDGPE